MIAFGWPGPLYNPITAPRDELLAPHEILAGPYGLLLFLPLVPLVWLLARRWPRATLLFTALVWQVATAGPWSTLVLGGGVLAGSAWLLWLGHGVARGRLSARAMQGLAWLGLSALILPLWWQAQWDWHGWHASRLPALHTLGFAYFYLRLIAWSASLARDPQQALRPVDTICWLLYPPIMRLGPVMVRERFLERLDAWNPRAATPWRRVLSRFGLFVLGVVALAVLDKNVPFVLAKGADFFSDPGRYDTLRLVRAFYLVPVQIYLLLWTYNELAATIGLLIGIHVDNNFDWLPKATSLRDFWRRWHITVGAWLRTYLYFPLGGSRSHADRNIMVVFLFCGVWHGASWSFVLWGLSQGIGLSVERWWEALRVRLGWTKLPESPLWRAASWLLTMHYQLATIIVFVDFEHAGTRFYAELARRAWAYIAG